MKKKSSWCYSQPAQPLKAQWRSAQQPARQVPMAWLAMWPWWNRSLLTLWPVCHGLTTGWDGMGNGPSLPGCFFFGLPARPHSIVIIMDGICFFVFLISYAAPAFWGGGIWQLEGEVACNLRETCSFCKWHSRLLSFLSHFEVCAASLGSYHSPCFLISSLPNVCKAAHSSMHFSRPTLKKAPRDLKLTWLVFSPAPSWLQQPFIVFWKFSGRQFLWSWKALQADAMPTCLTFQLLKIVNYVA